MGSEGAGRAAEANRSVGDVYKRQDQHFGPLYARAKPGYCSRCRGWLGQSASTRQKPAEETARDDQIWMATCVGDVLASMPQLDEPNLREILRENLCALVRDVAAGNLRAVCDLTGSPGTGLRGWLTGQQLPRPDLLFLMCSRLPVSYTHLDVYKRQVQVNGHLIGE